MSTPTDLGTFTAWLHAAIHADIAENCHCKSYEGEMDVRISDVFASPPVVSLRLSMYVIAPNGREHIWKGASVAEVCTLAHADISRWIEEGRRS